MNHFLTLLSIFSFFGTFAQKRVEHTLPSTIFGLERKITVYLPKEYVADSIHDFPVAYLFDGQFEPYLTMVSGMMEYYSQTNSSVALILVSVHTENRFEEFIPEPKTGPDGKTTYSTPLTEFLEKELYPFVDAHYRASDFKLGIGHSLGGTFLLYEAFKEHSPFGAIIAASPNTTLNEMTRTIPEYLEKHPEMTTFFYVTGGDTDQMELDFLQTSTRIDSAITARKSAFPDWNFRKYAHSNHMETFPKTFNDGFLLFSEKWNLTPHDLLSLKDLQDAKLEQEIKKSFERKSVIRQAAMPYSFRNVLRLQGIAEINADYETAYRISALSLKLLDTDSTVPQKDREELLPRVTEKRAYYRFFAICDSAQQAMNRKDYQTAAETYLRAFELNVLRGTFYMRISSLEAFAQSGNKEAAFKQIDLLANHFGMVGSSSLTGNPLLTPLHKDKRWNKYMKILDENTLE